LHTNVTKAKPEEDTTTKSSSSTKPSATEQARAELNSALNATTTTETTSPSALEKIGITRAQDGTLTVDQNKLGSALQQNPDNTRNLLSGLGQRVEQAAEKLLASKEGTGSKVDVTVARTGTQGKAGTSATPHDATHTSTVSTTTTSASTSGAVAVAAYTGIATL